MVWLPLTNLLRGIYLSYRERWKLVINNFFFSSRMRNGQAYFSAESEAKAARLGIWRNWKPEDDIKNEEEDGFFFITFFHSPPSFL